MRDELLAEISDAFANLKDSPIIVVLIEKAISEKIPANVILEKGLRKGLDEIGRKYADGIYFLADLLFAGSLMQDATKTLQPYITTEGAHRIGTLVLGTVRGDIHDIGKNVFKMVCEASGFAVLDLGVDVDPETFVDKLKETNGYILAMSALLTTTIGEMKTVITALVQAGLRENVKTIIGGNAVTKEFGKEIGVDAAALDAIEGVEICKEWFRN